MSGKRRDKKNDDKNDARSHDGLKTKGQSMQKLEGSRLVENLGKN